jgi:MFS family permease
MRQRRAIHLMLGGGAVFALLEIALGLSRNAWLAGLLGIGVGFSSMLVINTINATVQANVSDRLRGRVMALFVTVFAGTAPIGSIFAGAVAEVAGTPEAFVIGAILSLGVTALVAWRFSAAASAGRLGITRIDSSGLHVEPAAPGAGTSAAA